MKLGNVEIEVVNRYYRLTHWLENGNTTEVDFDTRLDLINYINDDSFDPRDIKSIRQVKEYKINE